MVKYRRLLQLAIILLSLHNVPLFMLYSIIFPRALRPTALAVAAVVGRKGLFFHFSRCSIEPFTTRKTLKPPLVRSPPNLTGMFIPSMPTVLSVNFLTFHPYLKWHALEVSTFQALASPPSRRINFVIMRAIVLICDGVHAL